MISPLQERIPAVWALALLAPLAAQGPSDFDSAVGWMRGAAFPLTITAPGEAHDDLDPVGAMTAGAQVVALGEEVHGVGSFVTLHDRVFRYLALEHGFRVLILEDSFEVVRRLDEGICNGGVADVFDELPLAWHVKNAEMLALLEWMEQTNAEREVGDRLRVYGLDVQNVSDAARGLEEMLAHIEGALDSAVRETLIAFRDFSWHVGNLPAESRERMHADLRRIAELLEREQGALVAATSDEVWRLARQRVRLLEQCQEHEEALATAPETSHALRDGFLAENLLWILEEAGPRTRAVTFSHNAHASRADYTAGWEDTLAPARSMGSHLREVLGHRYMAFGTFAYRGSLRPHNGGVVQRDRAAAGTWNEAFQRTGHAAFVLDVRGLPSEGPAGRWLGKEHAQSWGLPVGSPLDLDAHFDAVLFVERTTPPGE